MDMPTRGCISFEQMQHNICIYFSFNFNTNGGYFLWKKKEQNDSFANLNVIIEQSTPFNFDFDS